MQLKLKTKLALWYTSMLLLLLSLFIIYLYFFILRVTYTNEESLIKIHIAQVILTLNNDEDNDDNPFNNMFTKPEELISSGTYILIFDTNNKLIMKDEVPPQIITAEPFHENTRIIVANKTRWLIYDQLLYFNDKLVGWIRASRPLRSLSDMLGNIIRLSIFAIPAFILIALAGGMLIANRTLSPIDKITRTAREIHQGNLKKRLNFPKVEDEVGRLASTFDEMLDKLEAAFNRERQFTSDASHELRTPITIISAHAEESLEEGKSIQECKENLRIILRESNKMRKMVSELLMLTSSDEKKYKLEIETISLTAIVRDIIEEMRNFAQSAEIDLKLSESKEIKIRADQTLITMMMINLIDNAIKYGKNGGWIKVSISEKGKNVKIIIEDNGIGIAKEDITSIFQRYYRVDKSRTKGGSGLGLSIVKWIVDAHNGKISVESILDKGTIFEINIPK
jgi:signal transduction histidine kinase